MKYVPSLVGVFDKKRITLLVLLLSALLVYLKTMPRGLTWEHWGYDAGDLISCVYTWGIPHPSGTPLYVLVGQVFRHLPFFSNPAAKFNFMSIIFGLATVASVYHTVYKLTRKVSAAVLSGLFLVFTPLFWGQSIVAEVLTLNSFLISLVIFLLVCWGTTESTAKNNRLLYGALFCFGLSLTNHLSSITILPAILFLIWSASGRSFLEKRKLGFAALSVILGLLPLVYLPIRSAMRPELNWGDPSSLARFFSHFTGREYQSFLFFKYQWLVLDNAIKFLSSCFRNFNPVGFLLILTGLVFGRRDRVGDFLGFIALFQLVFIFNFNIVNIESYYLPVFIVLAIFLGKGVASLGGLAGAVRILVDRRWPRFLGEFHLRGRTFLLTFGSLVTAAFFGILAICGVLNVPFRFREVDLSSENKAESYGRETFKVLEPGAIVLTEGDTYTLGLTYFRYVAFPERTDVAVFHEAFFYKLDWMLKEARRNYPGLKYPRDTVTFNEKEALDALLEFIELNLDEHPIYLAVGDPPPDPEFSKRSTFADRYIIQSEGPVFKIVGKK